MIKVRPTIAVSAARVTLQDEICPTKAHWASQEVISALADAGGLPVVTPVGLPEMAVAALVDRADALVLTGGDDISVLGAPHRAARVDPIRDRSDLALLRLARQRRLPVFGICRGMQLLAVTAGGRLGPVVGHTSKPDASPRRHSVEVSPHSLLGTLLGDGPTSVSSLHQYAVQQTGEHEPVAWSMDGVIEAIEHPDRWELGVQWHPELDFTPFAGSVWRALIEAACHR